MLFIKYFQLSAIWSYAWIYFLNSLSFGNAMWLDTELWVAAMLVTTEPELSSPEIGLEAVSA